MDRIEQERREKGNKSPRAVYGELRGGSWGWAQLRGKGLKSRQKFKWAAIWTLVSIVTLGLRDYCFPQARA